MYTTWTQRIWPEIRVPDEDGQENSAQSAWTPVSPDVYSAPELIELLERLKSKAHELYQRAAALRTNSPGAFCVYASLSCLALGYLGTLMSTLALLYYLVVGSFVVPGLFKLLVTHQELSQLLSNLCNKKDSVDNQNDTRPAQSTITTSAAAAAAAVPEPENALTDQVSGMMQSVCSTLATGMATLTSQLPDMNQLEQKKQDLLSHDDSRSSDMEESMSPYLPDAQDLASHQILESCTRDSTFQDPTQPDSFQVRSSRYLFMHAIMLIDEIVNCEGTSFQVLYSCSSLESLMTTQTFCLPVCLATMKLTLLTTETWRSDVIVRCL